MTNASPARLGIIGCGNVTVNAHVPVIQRLDGVRAVAVADPVPARREHARTLLGLPPEASYAEPSEMLAQNALDYVLVAVPPAFRMEIFQQCARHGVHVLSEKPLATRPAEARALCEILKAAGLTLGMVHNYLYFPEYALLHRLILSGEIGAVHHVSLNFLGVLDKPGSPDYRPRWRHDPRESGGGVLMDMIHAAYLAEHLMAARVGAVSAVVDNLGGAGDVVEDIALVHLYFPEGYATINMGWGSGPGGVEVAGAGGRILVFYQDYGTGPFSELETFVLVAETGRRSYQPREGQPMKSDFLAVHQDFLGAVRDGRPPVAPGEAGQRALEVVLAAYASAVQGCVVSLPLDPESPVSLRGIDGLAELTPWPGSPVVKRRLFGLGDRAA